MNTCHYRVRTVEIFHLVDGLWSSSVFIHRDGDTLPLQILLHAGRSRHKETARHLAALAAKRCLQEALKGDACCTQKPPENSA
ncbi:hypothetical protein P6166_14515 [Stenotrophomonas sp. HITSZ_GD]|uniref:hypothetical protein n=1 Tax=Stenotrophomonas sp. HITSZ_GD TaxID=3037248 RepID=UPI00240D883B|nr:hypothetical protein [Stenotrophomonas sp. HITSZ_GD]MDG2526567.1 hypothetical protein [Stenotrophomonas sp. HITSZ_GD]